jgi:hypothetical protein
MNNKHERQLSDHPSQLFNGVQAKPLPAAREVELYTEGGAIRLRFKDEKSASKEQ